MERVWCDAVEESIPPRDDAMTSTSRRSTRVTLALLAAAVIGACARPADAPLSPSEKSAIADTLRTLIVSAYDLSKPGDAVGRMMSLYPASGNVVSASGGRMSVSRDSLESGIRAFWQYVGQNMRDPQWKWDEMRIDVLARDAAVATATYHVPHRTPTGMPHTIAGALTVAFQRREGRWTVVQEHLSDLPVDQPADTAAASTTPAMEHRHQ
jgi:hypothetical protein